MRIPTFARFRASLRRAEQWYLETPDRALDIAYDAALKIKAIEAEHFGGKKIAPEFTALKGNAYKYFETDLQKHLRTIRIRLTEFRRSRTTVEVTNPNTIAQPLRTIETIEMGSTQFVPILRDKPAIVLEKLKLIDETLLRYNTERMTLEAVSRSMLTQPSGTNGQLSRATKGNSAPSSPEPTLDGLAYGAETTEDFESISDKTGLLPRSIITTLSRLKRDLDPKSEAEVVQNYRVTKVKTLLAVRFVLILIIVPLLLQQATRNFVLADRFPAGGWVSHHFQVDSPDKIFLNSEMAEEALKELTQFEERLKFENLVKATLEQKVFPEQELKERNQERSEVLEASVQKKAVELAESFSSRSGDAIKNWIADIVATITFALVLVNGRREVEILKSFMDELVYGLSDSAKAFIIILFTDVFVGFHSPHGWEVILEGISKHLGIAPNHDFIFLFIATFPVILDTIFKYWIFRFLNRVSPSAVATYREMNE